MSNDFRSLLSTFQSATGDTKASHSTASTQSGKSLRELTADLWRFSQIRSSTKALAAAKPSTASTSKPTIHVAICLCIVDSLVHEKIWEEWMQESDADVSAELYVHAKTPERIRSSFGRSKLIPVSHRPDWNDVRIVKAMLSLIKCGLDDPKTTHVLFGTESCIPICPLSEIELAPSKSYVSYYGKDQASRFDERDVWDVLQTHIPIDAIHKGLPGWCCLSRPHCQEILDLPNKLGGKELWTAFTDCWAPEEAFFPTSLALLGLLDETECRSLTYAEWNERARRQQDRAHPKSWDDELDAKLVGSLRKDFNCVILRKVMAPVNLSFWKRIVNECSLKRGTEVKGDSNASKRPKVMDPNCDDGKSG